MIELLVRALSDVKRHHVAALLAVAAASIVGGGALFALTQGVSLGTGLYWAVVTASTVGYGDVTPHDTAGRIVAVAVILTTIPLLAAVFALMTGLAALVQVRRLFGMEHGFPRGRFSVVYGTHPAATHIVDELTASGRQVVLVADIQPAEAPPHARLIAGDPTSETVIRRSRPHEAENALVLARDERDVLVVCVALRAAAPELPVYALVSSPKIARALRDLGIHHTLAADELVAHVVAKSLEAPHAGDLLLRLIDSECYRLVEAPAPAAMVGRQVTDAARAGHSLVLGLVRDGTVMLATDERLIVRSGDALVTVVALTPPRR